MNAATAAAQIQTIRAGRLLLLMLLLLLLTLLQLLLLLVLLLLLRRIYRMIRIGQIEQRLYDFGCENTILLPQIQHPNDATLVVRRASEQIQKCLLHVSSESRSKNIFLWTELMAGLTHNRIDHIQTGHFVFGLAFEDEFLDALHDMLVEFDGLHGALRDGCHFRFGYGRPCLVQAGQLRIYGMFS